MMTKTVYQIDSSGLYVGETVADESPLEPGVWLLPARTLETPPPAQWDDDKWPRWNGSGWILVNKPQPAAAGVDAAAKLAAFLQQNPDVAALISDQTPA